MKITATQFNSFVHAHVKCIADDASILTVLYTNKKPTYSQ